jgi:Zn-dependent protease
VESIVSAEIITKFLFLALGVISAMTVHELAHAYVAWKMGDDTARRMGRVSLNPLRHLDPMGSIFFIVTAWAGMGIGWAKPVPVNYWRMQNPRAGMVLVSLAGPASNILLAVVVLFAQPMLSEVLASIFDSQVYQLLLTVAYVNAIFAFFNLLPLPPLDGSGVVSGLLPLRAARSYQKVGRYGFLILLALIFLPGLAEGFPNILNLLVRYPALQLIIHCLG